MRLSLQQTVTLGMKDKIAIGLVNLAAAEASTLIFGKLIEKEGRKTIGSNP